jgi:hypothetical protein
MADGLPGYLLQFDFLGIIEGDPEQLVLLGWCGAYQVYQIVPGYSYLNVRKTFVYLLRQGSRW